MNGMVSVGERVLLVDGKKKRRAVICAVPPKLRDRSKSSVTTSTPDGQRLGRPVTTVFVQTVEDLEAGLPAIPWPLSKVERAS